MIKNILISILTVNVVISMLTPGMEQPDMMTEEDYAIQNERAKVQTAIKDYIETKYKKIKIVGIILRRQHNKIQGNEAITASFYVVCFEYHKNGDLSSTFRNEITIPDELLPNGFDNISENANYQTLADEIFSKRRII